MTFTTLFRAGITALALSTPVFAGDAPIEISDAYARAAGHHAKSGAAFMVLTNTGDTDDRLIGATSQAAKRVELHTHIMADGVAKMRRIENGIELPAGGSHTMERGADHVMFMGLNAPFIDGETIRVTLTFERAGALDFDILVDSAR